MSRKIGRPRKTPPENAVEIIKTTASKGCSEKTIAGALGVSFDVWIRFKEENPELKEAYDQARAIESYSQVWCSGIALRRRPY